MKFLTNPAFGLPTPQFVRWRNMYSKSDFVKWVMWRKVFNLYESKKSSQIYLRWGFAQCNVWYLFKISQRFFEIVIFHNRKNSAQCSPHSHRLFRATVRWGRGAPTAWVLAQGGGLWGAAHWRDRALADAGPKLDKYHSPAVYQNPPPSRSASFRFWVDGRQLENIVFCTRGTWTYPSSKSSRNTLFRGCWCVW